MTTALKNSLLVIFCLANIYLFTAQSYGPFSPTKANDHGPGNKWKDENNIFTQNNSFAYVEDFGLSKSLEAEDFNFNLIPSDVVEGIQMDIVRYRTQGAQINLIANWVEAENSQITKFDLPKGDSRLMLVMIGAENQGAKATYGVSFDGIPLTFVTNVTVSAPGGFTSVLEVWMLKEIDMPKNKKDDIIVTSSAFTPNQYFTTISAAVYENVDQLNPFESLIPGTSTSTAANYQLPSAMTNSPNSMALTAIFSGDNTASPKSNGQSNCWSINTGFNEQIDVYRANTSCCASTGGCMQIANKSYAGNSANVFDQPTFTFNGSPFSRCALAISLRKGAVYDSEVTLLKNGHSTPNNAVRPNAWPVTNIVQTYGGPTDLWGTTWTPADINDKDFGGQIRVQMYGGQAFVDNVSVTVFYSSTLPIDLVHFTALKGKNKNELSWVTATEINSAHFKIERSDNGFDFYEIGEFLAAGTSTSPIHYTYNDTRQQTQTCYYRLKMVDLDGSFKYSEIRSVENVEIEALFFPNPVQNWATLLTIAESFNAQIISKTGKILQNIEFHQEEGKLHL
ncbi:MAG: hypothetical protein KKH44_01230, partial [Bacteroidetes bacterium]|nr:hypothetical protein [Bacteroidota bacterium]